MTDVLITYVIVVTAGLAGYILGWVEDEVKRWLRELREDRERSDHQ